MFCGFMPDEGFWILVVVLDEALEGSFQFFGGAMDAAPELLFSEQREAAFYQVEPTGRSGREVEMKAGPLYQPVTNQLCFMGAVVVQDQVHIQMVRHVGFDGVEEVTKLHGTMPTLGLADQRSCLGI